MSKSTSPYHEAGWILNELLPTESSNNENARNQKQRRGLKSLAFDPKNKKNAPSKATYATVCKTMQNLPVINAVINANGRKLRKAIGFDSVRNKGLMYVMLHELLFGKYKSIRGGGKIKRMIIKQEKELRKGADEYIAKHGLPSGTDGDDRGVNFPRYVRVNVLRSNTEDVIKLLDEGCSANPGKTNGGPVEESSKSIIYADAHVPDLLVLPPSASSWLHQSHEAVKSGKIILQDKSSCFSALVMARGHSNDGALADCDYIDACSAPGNKTSHLAALIHASIRQHCGQDEKVNRISPKKKKKNSKNISKSTIFAFERSSTRFKILQNRMDLLCPTGDKNSTTAATVSVEPTHGDFLKCSPTDPKYANVRAILLDPSCSGSGIVNSPDRWMEDANNSESATDDDGGKNNNISEEKKKRIQSLSNFQLLALKHAMSFKNVDRIVYSTCSVHDEENEVVVRKALAEANNNSETSGVAQEGNEWELVAPACLKHWPRRGNEGGIGGLTSSQASCLIRCDGLDGDETNGFFVSYFERKKMSVTREPPSSDLGVLTVNQSVDIPVYNGEFLTQSKSEVDISSVGVDDERIEELDNDASLIKMPNHKTKKANITASDNSKSAEKSAKKRDKKLAWKKKQAQLKAQRLKKKPEKRNKASDLVQTDRS